MPEHLEVQNKALGAVTPDALAECLRCCPEAEHVTGHASDRGHLLPEGQPEAVVHALRSFCV